MEWLLIYLCASGKENLWICWVRSSVDVNWSSSVGEPCQLIQPERRALWSSATTAWSPCFLIAFMKGLFYAILEDKIRLGDRLFSLVSSVGRVVSLLPLCKVNIFFLQLKAQGRLGRAASALSCWGIWLNARNLICLRVTPHKWLSVKYLSCLMYSFF